MAFTVYKAAAGSGKTFTLVKSYLVLALGAREVDGFKHILAVTFTNKAAAEMKKRVLEALAAFAGSGDAQKYAAMGELLQSELQLDAAALQARSQQVLSAMLHHYQQLSIGTIDGFVARLARQFARELLLDQQFDILLDQELLFRQTVQRLLARLGEDEALTALLVAFAQEQTEEERSWDIRKPLVNFCKLLLNEQMRHILPALRKLDPLDFQTERQRLKEVRGVLLEQVQIPAQALLDRLDALGITEEVMLGGSRGIYPQLQKLVVGDVDSASKLSEAVEKGKWYSSKASAATKSLLTGLADELAGLAAPLLSQQSLVKERLALVDAILQKQYAMATLALLQHQMEGWMEENQSAPLSSLYFRIAELLADTSTPFIYERLGSRYRHFLIDEFQDTSTLQWQNLLPLVENGLAGGHDSLVVGDAKQSIYRWRNGEAAQFVQLPFPHGDGQRSALLEDAFVGATLRQNFRSYREVIDFNNRFFSWLTQSSPGALADFYFELEQLGGKTGGLVQVELLPKPEAREDRQLAHVQRVVALAGELHAQGVPFGELAVLVRKNELGSQIAIALLEAGIPVVSSESLLLAQQPHIRLCMGLMQWLRDERDELNEQACVQLLEQLFGIRTGGRGRLQSLLRAHFGEAPLQKWRMLPLGELAAHILGYLRLLQQVDPFVLRLFDVLQEQSQRYKSLAELLEWWEDKGQKTSLQMPAQGDAVKVMTYHKSKGLEFGVVIVADADERRGRLGQEELWIDTELSPIGKALVATSKLKSAGSPFAELHDAELEMSKIDYINMLYVAFTRAVGGLYILGSEDLSFCSEYSFSKKWPLFLAGAGVVEEGIFVRGELPVFAAAPVSEGRLLTEHRWSDWRERIGLQHQFEAGKDGQAALSLGRMTHALLSELPDREALGSAVAALVEAGTLRAEDVDVLLPAIRALLRRPGVAQWFEPGLDVRNEISILSVDGRQHRPDRLVVQGERAHVLEFKTGAERPEHVQQLQSYLVLLQQMGYQASGELVYIDLEQAS